MPRRGTGKLIRQVDELPGDAAVSLFIGVGGIVGASLSEAPSTELANLALGAVLFGGLLYLLSRRTRRERLDADPVPAGARCLSRRRIVVHTALFYWLPLIPFAAAAIADTLTALLGIFIGGAGYLVIERRRIIEDERATGRHFYREARIRWKPRLYYADAPAPGGRWTSSDAVRGGPPAPRV